MKASPPSSRLQTCSNIIVRWLGTEWCFYVILACFAAQALWFALSARYPMAFDENFHFGLIKLHAAQWLPFFTHQPGGADAYGAVVRDPSYLYHFLLSIPYRFIRLVLHGQTQQIIALRVINICLLAWSYVLFRRLLERLGASRALRHAILLIFTLIPILPFLAAHINYDNLFIPFTAWTLLAVFAWFDAVSQRRLPVGRTVLLVGIMLLGCLVKFAFAPIMAAALLAMAWHLWRHRAEWSGIRSSILPSYRRLALGWKITVIVFGVLTLGLFLERYGVNMIRFHTPQPDCGQVLSVAACSQYGPWNRDYQYVQHRSPAYRPNVIAYVGEWIWGMWHRSFFAISDTYTNKTPLPLPGYTAAAAGAAGLALCAVYARRIWRGNRYRQFALFAMGCYVFALFLDTFRSYVRTGVPVAVNGRYLLAFLPVVMLFTGLAYRELFRHRAALKTVAVIVVLAGFLQGGGVITFIVQSDPSWDWPGSLAVRANNTARRILQPVVIGAKK